MTAGAEVVCNDVVRKVEIEDVCVANAGLDTCDLNVVCDVATVDGNVGGNGYGDAKDDSDESSYVFVSGGLEVSGDPDDTVGVNVDDFDPKSDSADEVDQLKKEEFGIENGGIPVDLLGLETKGIVHGFTTVSSYEVKSVKDDVNLVNGSTVDPPVVPETNAIAEDVNGHLDKIPVEEEALIKSIEEGDDANEITTVETKLHDIGSGVTYDLESTLNTTESSPVAVTELDSTIHQSDVTITQLLSTPDVTNTTVINTDCEGTVNDGLESARNLIDNAECQATVDGCDKPTEDLECQVTADGSESSGIPTKGQITVDESDNASEDLTSQVAADESVSFGSLIKEQECKVLVEGSDSIDSLVENQVCVLSVESEPSGNHAEEVDVKSKEHQELLVITSEVNVEAEPNYVCDGIKVAHQSVSVSVPWPSENNKAEGTDIGLNTESEKNPDSELVLSDIDALANEQAEKFDEILEMEETQISGTEADRSVVVMLNVENGKSEDMQMKGSSETLLKVTESVEIKVNSEDMMEQVKTEYEIQDSPIVVIDNVQDDMILEDKTTESANEAEVQLETETNIDPVIHVNTSSHYELSNSMDEPQEGFGPEGSSESVDLVISECNNSELLAIKENDSLSNPDELLLIEQKTEIVAHLDTQNKAAEDMDCGTGTENVDVPDDDEKETDLETDFKDAPVEYVGHLVTENRAAEGMDCGPGGENVDVSDDEERVIEVKDAPVESVSHLVIENIFAASAEGMDCGTGVKNVDFHNDEVKETEVNNTSVKGHSVLSFSDTIVNRETVIEFGSIGRHETTYNIHNEEAEYIDGIQSEENPTSSAEGSVIDSVDVKNEVTEVLSYNFLIRIPRYEVESFRDQIRRAQLLVDEKTRLRDAIRVEIQEKRARLKAHNETFNAARIEETAARRLVRLKRQEIDSVQVVINRWKNAMSVEDIDGRIFNMEHMIQHETLLLKDEKQFIREIKQLKTLRDQLASNMGSSEEIRQAIDQKDHNEELMKTLRKELDSLKDKASKAEAAVKTVGKHTMRKVEGKENSKLSSELQMMFAKKRLSVISYTKKVLGLRNKKFRQFREDLVEARKFASHGNKDALHHLCANQVETFMEEWNNNDEFRKEYISRCNMNASRRQRAWDGGPLIPDDMAPVRPNTLNENVDNGSVSLPGEVKSLPVVLPAKGNKIVSIPSTENRHTDSNNRSIEDVLGQTSQTFKTNGVAKPTALASDVVAVVTELAVDNKIEEENALTKVEIELAKKAEELRKEEIAAMLKERRRLEEKAKAIEALERKKRIAEKAQIRAELRARKEAEQKEKEREKRLRKKEKKKTGGGDGSMNREAVASSANANEVGPKDIESVPKEKNKKKAQPPPHFFSKQQMLKPKSIPPPLVNRNKKRWQQWGKLALAVAGIFVLFLLGNTNFRFKLNGLI
ncbi:hypothetical protein E3N88_40226 [Mikania micrantha]|uniref:Proton pump-interactor 1 n=1 Tax=Mikania micrantha TaxID=192012 RepID=A0A5N6LM43_9ASTR|nr:hypothetical protein E3N88_40226 [Mikania micrantha]